MADLYLGCLTYADDITLVSSSIAGLQRMLEMCTVYAKEHHLIFNSKKSVMITFKKKRCNQSHDPEVFFNDARLPNKDEIVHLGVVMNAHCAIESSLEARKRKFYAGVVTRLGGICSNDSVWMKIMECQLFPVLAYGCHLWNFEKSSLVTSVNTAYR